MRRLICGLGLLVLICSASLSTAQEATGTAQEATTPVAPEKVEKPQALTESPHDMLIAEDVRQRLFETLSFKCDHVPLTDVLEKRIAQPSKLDLYYDTTAIADSGIKLDELDVSGDFNKTSIRAILTRIL